MGVEEPLRDPFKLRSKGNCMRDCVLRLSVLLLAGVALASAAQASGSYSGSGFTPPKTKKETKPAGESSKTKSAPKKKTSELGMHGDYSRQS